MNTLSASEAFEAYEAARSRLPDARPGRPPPKRIETLAAIIDQFDVFLLDAFGVLNIGESPIAGVPERVRELQAAGKRLLVVSNAASTPRDALQQKYQRLGYDIPLEDIITSRMAAIAGLANAPVATWGVMGLAGASMRDFGTLDWVLLGDDPADYAHVGGFLLVGSAEWTENRQRLLEQALEKKPRPLRIANPDIVAPREKGYSTEPGHYAHRLARATGVSPMFFGKPFTNIFDIAFDHLEGFQRSRVVMVGDSLHTDVLGAQTAGIASVLISDFGFFAGEDVLGAIERSAIVPDYIARRP